MFFYTIRPHDTKPAMLARKLNGGNSKTKKGQAMLLLLLLLLFSLSLFGILSSVTLAVNITIFLLPDFSMTFAQYNRPFPHSNKK